MFRHLFVVYLSYGYTDDEGMDTQRHGDKLRKIKMVAIGNRLVLDRSGITEDPEYRYGSKADIKTGIQ